MDFSGIRNKLFGLDYDSPSMRVGCTGIRFDKKKNTVGMTVSPLHDFTKK